MFVRAANTGVEYKREDHSFFRGIVVKNWDPQNLSRGKIYIPEISNQPLESWLAQYKNLDFRFPGYNNPQDVWTDTNIFEEIAKFLPYAEPCFPLIGENSPGRYYNPGGIATTTDGNYQSGFRTNDQTPPTVKDGSFGPSFWYERLGTGDAPATINDAFHSPTSKGNYTAKNNPYSYQYRPSNQVNKPKGVFCVPSVGSQVWVFHYRGDLNFPVYMGGRHDFRGNSLIFDFDAPQAAKAQGAIADAPEGGGQVKGSEKAGGQGLQSLDYPGVFENFN